MGLGSTAGVKQSQLTAAATSKMHVPQSAPQREPVYVQYGRGARAGAPTRAALSETSLIAAPPSLLRVYSSVKT